MLKVLFILLFALLSSATISFADAPSAVTAAFKCDKYLEAAQGQKIVESVQSNFVKVTTLKAQFFQDSYLSSVDQSELSSGNVSLLRPGKMLWHYDSPEEQIFIVKTHDLWLYQPKLKQVLIDSLDKVLISQLPTAFLMGVGDLTKDFTLKTACETKSAYVLALIPAKNSADVGELAAFDLLVDKSSFLPMGAQVLDVAANRTSILMRSVVAQDKTITDKTFEFVAPDGIDIDDRRKVAE